ncbi:DEAD/DEAH box helicase domain protein [Thermocrinis albus DSM 14484]|uniref:DEAD/DEAH box helicase domain protein n=1 Tax=Thermocrinis albus (strain DSM 14484 / JCM 11386 / HI 11/12) TaxID=638303 RepID=D3SMI4_THEAH|nr:DEAD/DEAH box helicase [Thermocrinis albus]ADC89964.1 DEAD/DEAH box helicase domain protein [Thermocrinis albus DSM 14484]
MRKIKLLTESYFSLSPPEGKAVWVEEPYWEKNISPLLPAYLLDERVPHPLLNPLQTVFFHTYEGGSALVCAPTSAGKSLLALIFMKRQKEGRLVYTAPTRSLVYEKARELRRYYGKDLEVRTGDRVIESIKEVKGRVVVATYESFVSALRNRSDWTEDVVGVVVDEVHQILKRWVVEELMVYALDRGIPLLGLSATVPGAEELASWMKVDLFLQSAWRPVPLHRRIHDLKELLGKDIKINTRDDEKVAHALLQTLYQLKKPGEKVILFVPKKSLGWKFLEICEREKIGVFNETVPFEKEEREPEVAFHNADVPKEERDAIEKAFRDGSLDILVATQTLAYGVNLPADRVVIYVNIFPERGGLWKIFPDLLDILQMEGRAGRLGIREEGFSDLLVYGRRKDILKENLQCALQDSKSWETSIGKDTLSFLVLLGHLYHGKDFVRFLMRFRACKNLNRNTLSEVEEFLYNHGFLSGGKPTPKGFLCVRTGIYPTYLEEFLRRQRLDLDPVIAIRPLLYTKKLDGLLDFVKGGESFEEDFHYVLTQITPCGERCFEDNTHQFFFYVEGLTFKYPNISHPPGEFSYLGTDALWLLRLMLDLQRYGMCDYGEEMILRLVHSVKYGVRPEYSSIAGVKGIGHIRANLLRRFLHREGIPAPPLGEKVEYLLQSIKDRENSLLEILVEERGLDKEKATKEVKKLTELLERNKEGHLFDDKILMLYAFLQEGPRALRMSKRDMLKLVRVYRE